MAMGKDWETDDLSIGWYGIWKPHFQTGFRYPSAPWKHWYTTKTAVVSSDSGNGNRKSGDYKWTQWVSMRKSSEDITSRGVHQCTVLCLSSIFPNTLCILSATQNLEDHDPNTSLTPQIGSGFESSIELPKLHASNHTFSGTFSHVPFTMNTTSSHVPGQPNSAKICSDIPVRRSLPTWMRSHQQ